MFKSHKINWDDLFFDQLLLLTVRNKKSKIKIILSWEEKFS